MRTYLSTNKFTVDRAKLHLPHWCWCWWQPGGDIFRVLYSSSPWIFTVLLALRKKSNLGKGESLKLMSDSAILKIASEGPPTTCLKFSYASLQPTGGEQWHRRILVDASERSGLSKLKKGRDKERRDLERGWCVVEADERWKYVIGRRES